MVQQQTDSIAAGESSATVTHKVHHVKPQTPDQVLRMLPADATPEQQDSAIQANFQPKEMSFNCRRDTLGMPGQRSTKNKSFLKTTLRDESYFKNLPTRFDVNAPCYGIAGDPVPYSISGDNMITGLLIGCFILAMIAFARSRRFISRQAKNFFYVQKSGTTTVSETTSEVRFQLFLILQTCLLFAIIYFLYTCVYVTDTFVLSSQYQMIAIYFSIFAAYFAFKSVLYWFVNWVFFDKKKNGQWSRVQSFVISMEGVALFPIVMLQTYFDLSMKSALIYSLIVVILVKLLSFYKCYIIFFRRISVFLQIILYFCALEVIPLFALWGIMKMTGNYLEINF